MFSFQMGRLHHQSFAGCLERSQLCRLTSFEDLSLPRTRTKSRKCHIVTAHSVICSLNSALEYRIRVLDPHCEGLVQVEPYAQAIQVMYLSDTPAQTRPSWLKGERGGDGSPRPSRMVAVGLELRFDNWIKPSGLKRGRGRLGKACIKARRCRRMEFGTTSLELKQG